MNGSISGDLRMSGGRTGVRHSLPVLFILIGIIDIYGSIFRFARLRGDLPECLVTGIPAGDQRMTGTFSPNRRPQSVENQRRDQNDRKNRKKTHLHYT